MLNVLLKFLNSVNYDLAYILNMNIVSDIGVKFITMFNFTGKIFIFFLYKQDKTKFE